MPPKLPLHMMAFKAVADEGDEIVQDKDKAEAYAIQARERMPNPRFHRPD